jgi:hypothetical protein
MLMRLLAAVLVLSASVAFADVYKMVDENGVVTYTDTPTAKAQKVLSSPKRAMPSGGDFRGIIKEMADRYGVDPSLIEAVIAAESNFNHRAVSEKGAMGLMQLMPATASAMGAHNPFNPEDNIEAGVRYLRELLVQFDGDLTLALAAYNAGPANVQKYGAVPPIKETEEYVKKVFTRYKGGGYVPPRAPVKARSVVYKITLEDGTVLYTDSPFYKKDPSRL